MKRATWVRHAGEFAAWALGAAMVELSVPINVIALVAGVGWLVCIVGAARATR